MSRQILMLPEFEKFMKASSTGRRLMPSGKKVKKGTIIQYKCAYTLLSEFEKSQKESLHIQLLFKNSMRLIQKEKNYWARFHKNFSSFLYKKKNCYDQYVSAVFKTIKTFFNYLLIERALPIGEFHKKFRTPNEKFTPAILSPLQLKFLILNEDFEKSSSSLQKCKDIFVFGSTVALRYQDLMRLKKNNIQNTLEGVYLSLHTQKISSEISIPLPRLHFICH